jgi:crotonobetainyl-CoA:carnitine CoA-transferase CaiB-like acyl-CoA transferase
MNSLDGIRILDLSRVLAGPWCTQTLADLGADVIKIERPGAGDDTRSWGPPFLKDAEGKDTPEAAYYLGTNRNKRSLTCDISKPEGQALIRELVMHCDVFIENFKVGDMARYGLDYNSLKSLHPRLVYCSVTGFGQTGPYSDRAGYDYAVQGIGGLMSVTGERDAWAVVLKKWAWQWPTCSRACMPLSAFWRLCVMPKKQAKASMSTWLC